MDSPTPSAGVFEDCARESTLLGAAGAGSDLKTDAWRPADQKGKPSVPATCTEEYCAALSHMDCAPAAAPTMGASRPPDGATGEASTELGVLASLDLEQQSVPQQEHLEAPKFAAATQGHQTHATGNM
jgi:hypothetical protein